MTSSHISLRAHDHGVKLGLVGFNFKDSEDLSVRIGGWVLPATYINSSFCTFSPAPVLEAGSYSVSVSNNGLDFSQASADVSLTYHDDFAVKTLSLYRVQIEDTKGEDLTITVTGAQLPTDAQGEFYCVFGPKSAYPFQEVVVTATINSDTSVTCPKIPTKFISLLDPTIRRHVVSLRFTYDL